MRIQPYLSKDGTGEIKVYPGTTKQGNVDLFHSVSIYVSEASEDRIKKAEVNWSGCGSQSPSAAFAYGEGIWEAASIARYINESEFNSHSQVLTALFPKYSLLSREEHDAYWAEKKSVTV